VCLRLVAFRTWVMGHGRRGKRRRWDERKSTRKSATVLETDWRTSMYMRRTEQGQELEGLKIGS
jgi:hypothetical protein